jgi:uncharacterized protein YukE
VGSGSKAPSALAPFAHDWVGGDIHGLSAYAGTLYGYVPEIDNVATALGKKVGQIVGDARWQGSAAASFAKAWDRDSVAATALALTISAAGNVVNQLAVNLARIENALEKAAEQTAAHGVPVGADGQGPQVCYANAATESWRSSYEAFWNQCMLAAARARANAAGALQSLYGEIGPPGSADGLGKGDYTALFDTLAGFWGAQTRYRAYVEGKLPGLKQTVSRAITAAREDARQADGRFGPWTEDDKAKFGDAKTELAGVNEDLTTAESNENLFSKAWGFSPSDISGVGSSLEDMGGLFGNSLRFAADIPLVDVAAAGAGTYFGAQEDIKDGVPWEAAYPGEATSNLAAVGLGAGIGDLATGGVAAGLGTLGAGGLGVSLIAGGGGVLAGGIVAYGVADFGHNLIDENWGGDIHQHGVVLGVADGIGDSAVKTGKDFVHMGSSVVHGAEHLWNSIF